MSVQSTAKSPFEFYKQRVARHIAFDIATIGRLAHWGITEVLQGAVAPSIFYEETAPYHELPLTYQHKDSAESLGRFSLSSMKVAYGSGYKPALIEFTDSSNPLDVISLRLNTFDQPLFEITADTNYHEMVHLGEL